MTVKLPKTKTVTRDLIIEALKTEPLSRGYFFKESWDQDTNIETCSVCAVGAVIRKSVNKETLKALRERNLLECDFVGDVTCKGAYTADSDLTPRDLIEEKNWMGALSVFFEDEAQIKRPDSPEMRKRLISFVRRNFPEKIRLRLSE